VRKDVEAGLSFSDALARHPKVFSPLFVAMTRAGEIGGVLEDSLRAVADQLEKEDNLRRQVRSAMVYPSVVLSVALIVMIVLVVYIVPVFAGVLSSSPRTPSGQSLPAMTQVTVDVSHAITGYWYAFIAGAAADRLQLPRWKTSETGRPSGTRCA
jgi:type IV pilus assembly protein PilC